MVGVWLSIHAIHFHLFLGPMMWIELLQLPASHKQTGWKEVETCYSAAVIHSSSRQGCATLENSLSMSA